MPRSLFEQLAEDAAKRDCSQRGALRQLISVFPEMPVTSLVRMIDGIHAYRKGFLDAIIAIGTREGTVRRDFKAMCPDCGDAYCFNAVPFRMIVNGK